MSGAIGIIVAIVFIVRYLRNRDTVPDRTNPPNGSQYFWVWLAYLGLTTLSSLALYSAAQPSRILEWLYLGVLAACSVFLFPSFYARISILLGWVKTSYFLGRIAYSVHRQDLFAGALLYGWRALARCGEEQKTQQRAWLAQKLAQHRGTLGSGTMVMQALIKYPQAPYKELRALFHLLQGVNKNWLPSDVALSAFRFILARSCAERDFAEIRAQARYWQLVCKNRFAQWVDMYHWSLGATTIPFSLRVKIAWLDFWVGNRYLKHYLPQLKPPIEMDARLGYSLEQLKLIELKIRTGLTPAPSALNTAWQGYLAGPAGDEWLPRIKALCSFNENEVLARLDQSVRDLISLRSGEGDLDSEAAMQERDMGFKLLQIKINAMVNRSEQGKMMTGMQEYEEFLALVKVAERLGKDDHSRAQVFFQMRSPVWNWMVELWNNTKNRPLAFLAGSYMAPLAQEFGDTDAHDFFAGIVGHKFN